MSGLLKRKEGIVQTQGRPGGGTGKGKDRSSHRASKGTMALPHLDFRLLVSRTEREYIPVVLGLPVRGSSL